MWAALDVRELVHQLDESAEWIALVAGVVALVHLMAAGAAGRAAASAEYAFFKSA